MTLPDRRLPDDERILELVSEARNRRILSVVRDADGSVPIGDLAETIVASETPLSTSAEFDEEVDRLLLALHHERLPKLEAAGLVEYDGDENVVASPDTPSVDAEWRDGERIDELLAQFGSDREREEDAVGVIEGRRSVIDHGRTLVDRAEEELFCMYVSDDLLEEECIRRARAAIERGVAMCVGSQNRSVRDLTRNRLPEATIWEPQMDWLNAASDTPSVGRLVFADRERIMLAILDDPDAGGSSPETAMIGAGPANPLVVLARELLGSRLDHLDYQNGTVPSELPFEP